MTPPNCVNRTMWTGDDLNFMHGMNSESVDLIYLDLPSTQTATTPRRLEAKPRARLSERDHKAGNRFICALAHG